MNLSQLQSKINALFSGAYNKAKSLGYNLEASGIALLHMLADFGAPTILSSLSAKGSFDINSIISAVISFLSNSVPGLSSLLSVLQQLLSSLNINVG